MSLSSITTNILSSLGNNTGSVIPIATKDLIQNQVIVAQYHKDGGKHDAFEKFIEENGTSAIWLGGLPLAKKIMDKTIYKAFSISPDVDIKKLKKGNADSIEFAMNKLKEQGKESSEQYKTLNTVLNNKNLTKALFVSKFAVATLATLFALTKIITFKQKSTEEKVKHKVMLDKVQENALHKNVKTTSVGKMFYDKFNPSDKNDKQKSSSKDLSFKGLGDVASAFMYNPILNQSLLDVGITGLRYKTARDGERRDVMIKEAFEIAFLYPLAYPIQRGFDLLFGKLFNKNTDLDYNVLASDSFETGLADNSLKNSLNKFMKDFDVEKFGKDANVDNQLLNFIYDNPDNAVVKFLKDAGDVSTVSKVTGKKFGMFDIKQATDEIDSLAFIDTKSVQKSIKKLSKTVDSMDGAVGNIDKIKSYLKGARKAKGLSIVSAIAFGIWAMGVLQTKVVLKARKETTGTTENAAVTNLEQKIRHQMAFEGKN